MIRQQLQANEGLCCLALPILQDENRFSDDLISEMLNELSTYKTYE